MDATTIIQNRSNYWTGFGVLLAVILLSASAAAMIAAWPVTLSFEWILLPSLFLGSLTAGANYLYWMISPREAVFSVSTALIQVEDQPWFRWCNRSFQPLDVTEITYNSESSSYLRTTDGKRHLLSDILMMRRDEIFSAVSDLHPHIMLTINNKPNKAEMATPRKPSD
jgi:hypothetical protein